MPTDTPRHPLSEESLKSQPNEILTGLVTQLQNANAHLEQSNSVLREAGSSTNEYSSTERAQFEECMHENHDLIQRQSETITRARRILEDRLGISVSNPHYALATDPNTQPVITSPPAPAPVGESTDGAVADDQAGIYL